jgi:hypothetical protein
LPEKQRLRLKPGSCDGLHPEYTEAFDIAGLRIAADFAEALGDQQAANDWRELAQRLFVNYDRRFSKRLGQGYGNYCVLWPCRLYPTDQGAAHEQFKGIGKTNLSTWRYFAPATAHQGLLAGNRRAGYETVNAHMDHPQMKHWFAFDEGGKSGSGGWPHLRATWKHSKVEPDKNHAVAMPHGWAIAEVWLLMRDCLLMEDAGQLRLFAGTPPAWFADPAGMQVENLPTAFGKCSFRYSVAAGRAILDLADAAAPPKGYLLHLPPNQFTRVLGDGQPLAIDDRGRCRAPASIEQVELFLRK